MTENEDLELRRLEVNIGRLVQLVSAQDERIRQLQERLSLQDSELQSLRTALSEEQAQHATSILSQALVEGAGERAAARQLRDGLIQEVERCLQQLEHE